MNQSVRTFTLTGLVAAGLLLMHELPPLSIGSTALRHVNILSQLLPEHMSEQPDVVPAPKIPKPLMAVNRQGKAVAFKEVWPKGVEPIADFSAGKAGGMDAFYAKLSEVKQLNRPVRIAYFGDSFIEGDILTSNLRELFQQHFGGSGVGWVDCGTPLSAFRRTVKQQYRGVREFSVVKKPFDKQRQGIAQRYYVPAEGAQVTTQGSGALPYVASWQCARLFLRSPQPIRVTVEANDQPASVHLTQPSDGVQMIETRGLMRSVRYAFSDVTPRTTLFGMALESNKGVILDNFSMRGSSGVQLGQIPQPTLSSFARLRPYDLIVVHYGINAAVQGNTLPLMRSYMKRMKRAIEHLRASYPMASILVVSVPDRDQRTADGITTMKEVKALVGLQAQLAADCGVGFLNLFQAMGGESSMKRLVDRNLANKDYTHLSFGGGKQVAGKVFPSFMAGFENYKRRKALELQ